MAKRSPEHPNAEAANTAGRWLGRARTFALAAVVALPPVLNAQNIVGWAKSTDGLGLPVGWAWLAFAGLDLIAAVCVIETLIQAALGRKAGPFALLVWAFAFASAYAGYRHGTQPGVGRDVKWFFPFLAIAGPALLHLILKRSRLDKQADAGRRITHAPAGAYGWTRWIPGVGAFGETYCAWRVGRLEGIVRPAEAIARYRTLRPNAGRGGLFVLRAMRVEAEQFRHAAVRAEREATDEQAIQELCRNVRDQAASVRGRLALSGAPIVRAHPLPEHTERAEQRAVSVVRSIESARHKPSAGAKPNTTRAEKLDLIKARYPDWRTIMPSVRDCADVLGVAVSTAHGYRQNLVRQARESA